jgi:four helix bundle protein
VRCAASASACVVQQIRLHSADLADQLERAGTSVVHNLAEGSRRIGKDQKRFYAIAHGSAAEIRAAIDVADAWGWKTLDEPPEVSREFSRRLRCDHANGSTSGALAGSKSRRFRVAIGRP